MKGFINVEKVMVLGGGVAEMGLIEGIMVVA